jgi:hypothetical protein
MPSKVMSPFQRKEHQDSLPIEGASMSDDNGCPCQDWESETIVLQKCLGMSYCTASQLARFETCTECDGELTVDLFELD